MPYLSSSAISYAEYENGYLTIRFRDGTTYIYAGVPQIIYETLITASSPGSYFNRDIRNDYRLT